MKVLLAGATGFVGTEVLKQLMNDRSITQVTVLTRRPIGISHTKLEQIVVQDFMDYSVFREKLQADACIWCLGVSQTAVSKEEYIRITHDYTIEAAKAMFAENREMKFCFLSGSRSDLEENTNVYYGKIKGRTEKHLLQLSPNVYTFRPAFIRPAYAGQKRPFITKLFTPVADIADLFTDNFSVGCRQLAQCMIAVAKQGASEPIWGNKRIKQWA